MKKFENKTVMVTGAGANIGKEIAISFARQGANVIVCDYKRENAEQTAKEIEEMLALASINTSEFYELYGEKKIKDAIIYAKDLKDRYSVLWLNYDVFGEN